MPFLRLPMEIQYDDTLPCLQAIAPWWSNTDRMLLYCRLLAIFPLDADYLSSIDRKTTTDQDYSLTAELIQREYQTFRSKSVKGKYSCNTIRSLEFSFGKFNKRLCFLCPFHGTYKNEDAISEHRFIYYLLNSEKLSLSQYLNGCSRELKDIFVSHYPVFVNNILIDAYPFYLFTEGMVEREPGIYLKEPEACSKSVLEYVHACMLKRIKYNRSLEIMVQHIPTLLELLPDSADMTWDSILNMKPPFGIVNASVIKRVFNCLVQRKSKYAARKPIDYITKEKSFLMTAIQKENAFGSMKMDFGLDSGDKLSNQGLQNVKGEDVEDTNKTTGRETGQELGEELGEEIGKGVSALLDNPLAGLLDEKLLYGENLDERLGILINKSDSRDETQEVNVDEVEESAQNSDLNEETERNITCTEENEEEEEKHEEKIEASSMKSLENTELKPTPEIKNIPSFFELPQDVRIFVYGSDSPEVDKSILDAFLAGSSYFSVDVVKNDDSFGLLIMNEDNDFVFYNAELYGASPVRKMVKQCENIYTANGIALSVYLSRCKVYGASAKDLSMLRYYLCGTESSFSDPWLSYDTMKSYRKDYETLLQDANENIIEKIKSESSFLALLFSSGYEPPFEGLKNVASITNRYQVTYLYHHEKIIRSGAMLQVRALWNEKGKDTIEIEELYKDVCLNLNNHYALPERSVYILRVSEDGILIYAAGNQLDIQKIQCYLSSCCRRVFGKFNEKFAVTIYEAREDYSPTPIDGNPPNPDVPDKGKKRGKNK